jgi:non-ribosomal peptide synthetase component F
MTLLATYYVFLYRYTGQDDIVVGTDIANRNHSETEGLMGFFMNNLPLRVSLSGNPTFRELLNRVRTSALGAYTHQDLPFATLVKALQPKRSLSNTPIFQTLFVLQATPAVSSAPKELEAAPIDADLTTSKFDLALMLAESGEELIAYWTYRTELFRSETIIEIGKDFNRILASIPQHLDSPLTILAETERKQNNAKNFRLSSKTLYANQEKLDPAL